MVELTFRDLNLLRDLYEKTLLSFKQIQKWHFANLDKSTCHNRLKKLIRAELIHGSHLGKVTFQGELVNVGVIYALTLKGLRLLQMKSVGEKFREVPVLLNTSTLIHDLRLNELIENLKRKFPEAQVVHEKLLEGKSFEPRHPDAVMKLPKENKLVAIELELTAKSERRYRQIVTHYQVSESFDYVLYVTGSVAIKDKLVEVITHRRVEGFSNPTGKFYFADMELSIVSNGENELLDALLKEVA